MFPPLKQATSMDVVPTKVQVKSVDVFLDLLEDVRRASALQLPVDKYTQQLKKETKRKKRNMMINVSVDGMVIKVPVGRGRQSIRGGTDGNV